jgi:hypothetical protein
MDKKIRSRKYTWIVFLICFCFAAVGALVYAPQYLAYADKPVKSDVVVPFVGNDFNAREKEALKLLEEGYAQHLIIPAFGTMYKYSLLSRHFRVVRLSGTYGMANKKNYPRYHENTHIEVQEAKKMMAISGFKSAIFVSSPYHMRRIKTMAEREFKNIQGNKSFVPTRYVKVSKGFSAVNNITIQKAMIEYVKLAWFYVYSTLRSS